MLDTFSFSYQTKQKYLAEDLPHQHTVISITLTERG